MTSSYRPRRTFRDKFAAAPICRCKNLSCLILRILTRSSWVELHSMIPKTPTASSTPGVRSAWDTTKEGGTGAAGRPSEQLAAGFRPSLCVEVGQLWYQSDRQSGDD